MIKLTYIFEFKLKINNQFLIYQRNRMQCMLFFCLMNINVVLLLTKFNLFCFIYMHVEYIILNTIATCNS